MRIHFDEEVVCPRCGHEDVAWQVTRESETVYSKDVPVAVFSKGKLIIDVICQNPECKAYGRIKRTYKQ